VHLWSVYEASVATSKKRKTMVVALARKLLIALWRFVATGDVPQGVVLRPASRLTKSTS
jgi:transposase